MENVISVGKPYQIKLPTGAVGAISDFFRNSHRLIVTMPNISASEEHVLRNGDLFCGLLAKDGAILLLWEFRSKGSRAITLDSPFDARLVPELLNIKLDDSESRYCIDVHCSGQLKLATVLEFSQYNRSDSLGVRPPLY